MKLFIEVMQDRFGFWRASFTDSFHETYGGFSPRAATRSLFICNRQRHVDEARMIAMDLLSPTHLRVRVKTRTERPAVTGIR